MSCCGSSFNYTSGKLENDLLSTNRSGNKFDSVRFVRDLCCSFPDFVQQLLPVEVGGRLLVAAVEAAETRRKARILEWWLKWSSVAPRYRVRISPTAIFKPEKVVVNNNKNVLN